MCFRSQIGGAIVETALSLLAFLVMVTGLVEFSRYSFYQNLVSHAADTALASAAVKPGLEKFLTPNDEEYKAAYAAVIAEGQKIIARQPGNVKIDNFQLIMPTLNNGETPEEALNNRPMEIRADFTIKSVFPWVPNFVSTKRFLGHREPRHSGGVGAARDCAGEVFFGNSNATAQECNCPPGTVVNSQTGQCGCAVNFKDTDPGLNTWSCVCDVPKLGSTCPADTEPDPSSCTCVPCPGRTKSPGGGAACQCSTPPPASCNTNCQLEASTGRWVGKGFYPDVPCTPKEWDPVQCVCACPASKSRSCPPSGLPAAVPPYTTSNTNYFNQFFCECSCGGAAIQGKRLSPRNNPPDANAVIHNDDYECICGDGSNRFLWGGVGGTSYWCACANTCPSPKSPDTSACGTAGPNSAGCCACICPGGTTGPQGPNCDQCPPQDPAYIEYNSRTYEMQQNYTYKIINGSPYLSPGVCCPSCNKQDPNRVAIVRDGGIGCECHCAYGYSDNVPGHIGTCVPTSGSGNEG